jgi:protein TonB
MRIEICVALLASTALHAGVIFYAPANVSQRQSAAPAAAEPAVITARLKNTFATGKSERKGRLESERTPAAQPVGLARATRMKAAVKQEMRVDNSLRFYPPEAVAKGLEGEAILMLRIGPDGSLVDAQIAKSSGHAILDKAALRAVRASPHFGTGPREMLFPVTFALH